MHVQRDEEGRIIGADGAGEGKDQENGTDGAAESALLHFSSPRDAATIAAFLCTRVHGPEALVWLEGYQALLRWLREHGITGLHAVPYDGGDRDRRHQGVPEFDAHRKELLDAESGLWSRSANCQGLSPDQL